MKEREWKMIRYWGRWPPMTTATLSINGGYWWSLTRRTPGENDLLVLKLIVVCCYDQIGNRQDEWATNIMGQWHETPPPTGHLVSLLQWSSQESSCVHWTELTRRSSPLRESEFLPFLALWEQFYGGVFRIRQAQVQEGGKESVRDTRLRETMAAKERKIEK